MTTPVNENLTLYQGETFRHRFKYQNTDGTAVDISGCTARMQVRASADAVDPPLLDLTTVNGRLVISGTLGLIDVVVAAADLLYGVMTWNRGVYDLELVWPSGIVDKLAYGNVKVVPEITR